MVRINGVDQHELIRRLIGVADPEFRDDLAAAAFAHFRVRV